MYWSQTRVTHTDSWILTGYNGSLEGTCLFLLRYQHCEAPWTLQQRCCCHDLELLCGFTLPVCFSGWAWFSWRAGAPISQTCNTSNQQLQLKHPWSAPLLLPDWLWLHRGDCSCLFDNPCIYFPPLTLPRFSATSPAWVTSEPCLHKTPSLNSPPSPASTTPWTFSVFPPPVSCLLPYHNWVKHPLLHQLDPQPASTPSVIPSQRLQPLHCTTVVQVH